MSEINRRGLTIFAVMVGAAVVLCWLVPFVILPNLNIAMALPVVQLPGEVYSEGWPAEGFEFTNTLAGTLLTDVTLLLIGWMVFRRSNGWRNKVPGRLQGFIEAFSNFLYGFVKQMAGTSPITRNQLFPLVATIFLFLWLANWWELVPGVDSIGILHCAGHHGEQNGYGRHDGLFWSNLSNDQPMFSGYTANADDYDACHDYLEGHWHAPEINAEAIAVAEAEGKIIEGTGEIYTVHEGDTIESVASDLGLAVERITELNGEAGLVAGEDIWIEAPEMMGRFATNPDNNIFVVTPFIRAAATDLNLTFGLAIISFFAFQYFGVKALGMNYFQKFINVHALGNIRKKPMGAMDFLVGLFEIISEFAKMISLSFRLFGNIFAGQLLLFIMAFLVATMLPVIFYGLEVIVGFMQALVFAALTLVFSAQAMESHIHDDDHDDH